MWIKTGNGSLLNLEKCRDLRIEQGPTDAALRLVATLAEGAGEGRPVVLADGLTAEQAKRANRDLSVLLEAVEVDPDGAVVKARR